MADLVSLSVVTLSQTITPWLVVTADPNHNFSDLFQPLKAGLYPSFATTQKLLEVVIDSVAVGQEKHC